VSAIWVSFLVFALYLLIAAAMVEHRQLFLDESVKLPVPNIDLSMPGFFVLAPSLVVIFHAYVLVQVILLGRTAAAVRVPKLRRQTFETAIIEPYRRREASVEEALIEMYLAGVFVRRVEDITEALRGTRVSPSTVSDLNKKIYATIEAREKAQRLGAKLREQHMSKAAELVEGGVRETLAYYAFPEEHWRRIRKNNPLERILREIRRRTCVVGAVPNGQSALNLAAARLRHVAGTEWSTKRYLSMNVLKDHQTTRTTA
jgi:transposase-like protein